MPCAGGSGDAGGAPGAGARGFLQEQGGAGGVGVIPATALGRAGVRSRPLRASVSPRGGAAVGRVRFAGSAPPPRCRAGGGPELSCSPPARFFLAFSVSFRSFFAHRCFPVHTPRVRGEETAPGRPGGLPAPCAARCSCGGGPGPSHPPRKELFPALPPSNPAVVMGIKRGVSSGVFGGGGFARFVPGGCEPERAVPRSAQQEEQSCELSLSSSLCSLLSLTASLSHGSHVQPPAGPRGGSGRCGDKACGYGAGSGRGSRPHFPTAPRSPGVSEGAGGCRELGGSLWSQRAPLIL